MKRTLVKLDSYQALNIRAILINCQRMIEAEADEHTGHHVHELERIKQALEGLSELGPLPKELEIV